MAVRTPTSHLKAGSHLAENDRLFIEAIFGAHGADSGGVVRDTDLAVTANGTPNYTINVAAGHAILDGTQSVNQGHYHFYNDGTVNLGPITTPDGTNPRKDVIVAKVNDNTDYGGGGGDAFSLAIVTGTPTVGLTQNNTTGTPTLPDNCLPLARIWVPAGLASIQTANITDLRTRATALGGTIPLPTATFPTLNLWHGMRAVDLVNKITYIYDGASWVPEGQYSKGWTFIQEVVLVADGAISITSIPATFTDLMLVFSLRHNVAELTNALQVRLNNDSGANYNGQQMYVQAGTVAGLNNYPSTATCSIGNCLGTTSSANAFASGDLILPGYSKTDRLKHFQSRVSAADQSVAANSGGVWKSTAAVNRIDFATGATAFANTSFKAGSYVRVYGCR